MSGMEIKKKPLKGHKWKIVCILYLFCCALIDLYPHWGSPYFRYTGSDPTVSVWNLGWPLTVAIYDARSGLHIGPFAIFVLGFQFILLTGLAGTAFLIRMRRQDNTQIQ